MPRDKGFPEMGAGVQDTVTHKDAWDSWGSGISSIPWLTLQEAKWGQGEQRFDPGRLEAPPNSHPQSGLVELPPACVVRGPLSPSRPQHLADQFLQADLGSPEKIARGRGGGNVGSQPSLLGK